MRYDEPVRTSSCSVHGDTALRLARAEGDLSELARLEAAIAGCVECQAWAASELTNPEVARGVAAGIASLELPRMSRSGSWHAGRLAAAAAVLLTLAVPTRFVFNHATPGAEPESAAPVPLHHPAPAALSPVATEPLGPQSTEVAAAPERPAPPRLAAVERAPKVRPRVASISHAAAEPRDASSDVLFSDGMEDGSLAGWSTLR